MLDEAFVLGFITWANLKDNLIREFSLYTNTAIAVRILFNVG